jgi:hypothetical protein
VNSFGQTGVTNSDGTASASIITPISLTKVTDMSFGNIAVNATNGGTVILVPAGTRTATGGVTLPTIAGGTVTAASFTVNGQGNNTYTITLPVSNTIRIGAAGATMIVNAFTSTPSGIGTLSGGTQTLNIGATLNVIGGQAPGDYVSIAPFSVTVNYN